MMLSALAAACAMAFLVSRYSSVWRNEPSCLSLHTASKPKAYMSSDDRIIDAETDESGPLLVSASGNLRLTRALKLSTRRVTAARFRATALLMVGDSGDD